MFHAGKAYAHYVPDCAHYSVCISISVLCYMHCQSTVCIQQVVSDHGELHAAHRLPYHMRYTLSDS